MCRCANGSQRLKPDVAIVVYNDHAAEFSFDKYPTFALGVAERYAIGDEGFGTRPLPEVPGDLRAIDPSVLKRSSTSTSSTSRSARRSRSSTASSCR